MGELRKILEEAGNDFYRIDRRWQPKDLLPVFYTRSMLEDVEGHYERLKSAWPELKTLARASKYDSILRRMYLTVRQAKFAWRYDDLVFLQAIAEAYQDYGTVLQMLKTDEARGRLP